MKAMNKNILLLLIVSAFVGCMEAEPIEQEPLVNIEARMEVEIDTKTVLSDLTDGMYYPLWSAGDEIAAYAEGMNTPSKLVLTSGEGTTIASFSGSGTGEESVALYPFSSADAYVEGVICLTIPQVQKYVKDSFGQGAFPMIATGSKASGFKFMNLCAVMKISMTGSAAIKSITLTANDPDTYLSGPATVDVGYDAEPELVMAAGGSNSVILEGKGTELSTDSPTDFYVVIPAQTYKGGITLTIDAYNDVITKTISSDLIFDRSQIRHLKDIELDVEVPDVVADAVPENEIWYFTTNGSTLVLNKAHDWWGYPETDFGANVVSNTYVDGKGIIKFDGPVTKVGEYAFMHNTALVKMYIPASVTSIESSVFESCTELQSVYLPDKLDYISPLGFSNCPNLSEFNTELASQDKRCLVIDSKLVAFAPAGLTEYTTPEGVEAIADNVFNGNSSLKKIIISEGVKHIGYCSFAGSTIQETVLEEVYLPSTLETLGVYAFMYQKKIKAFYGNNAFVSDDNKCLIVQNYNGVGYNTIVAFASGSDVTEYTIPDGVQAIESYAFYHAVNLKKLNFPDSFEVIFSGHAFEGTTNIEAITGKYVLEDGRSMVNDGKLIFLAGGGLESYTTPEEVTSLGNMVLNFNDDLKEIVLSDEVKEFDGYGYIFDNNPKLETVTISARMTSLGYDPFVVYYYGTPVLKTVYCRALIPPVVYYNGDITNPSYQFEDLTIYVPKESYDMYLSSAYWDVYEKYLQPYDFGDLSEFYPDYYISTDYSQDGKVITLQTATRGNGIDVVFMGDAYSDRQIADGTYRAAMETMYDNLFTEEPYKSFKDMFNVYYVNVVSMTEGYDVPGSALDGFFGDGTLVGGNDNAVFSYALKAISEDEMDEALLIVAMNSDNYAGTCYMYYPSVDGDYGSGPSVSYFPRGGDESTFASLLHHEANGHGFAKLADEYAYDWMGAVPNDYVSEIQDQQNNWGWWKNVDFTDDLSQVRWSHFLNDDRYDAEGLGAFEGGLTYWTGVWRPTENSIMRYNTGGFNAPSREAIYHRIHKLAYGDSWEYDYEEFVEWDEINRSSASSAGAARSRRGNYVEQSMPPTAPPVVVGRSWRE